MNTLHRLKDRFILLLVSLERHWQLIQELCMGHERDEKTCELYGVGRRHVDEHSVSLSNLWLHSRLIIVRLLLLV